MDKLLRNFIKVILRWLGLYSLLGAFFGKAGFQVVNYDYRISFFIFLFCLTFLMTIEIFTEE